MIIPQQVSPPGCWSALVWVWQKEISCFTSYHKYIYRFHFVVPCYKIELPLLAETKNKISLSEEKHFKILNV